MKSVAVFTLLGFIAGCTAEKPSQERATVTDRPADAHQSVQSKTPTKPAMDPGFVIKTPNPSEDSQFAIKTPDDKSVDPGFALNAPAVPASEMKNMPNQPTEPTARRKSVEGDKEYGTKTASSIDVKVLGPGIERSGLYHVVPQTSLGELLTQAEISNASNGHFRVYRNVDGKKSLVFQVDRKDDRLLQDFRLQTGDVVVAGEKMF